MTITAPSSITYNGTIDVHPSLPTHRGRNVTELNAIYPIPPLSDEPAELRACALQLIDGPKLAARMGREAERNVAAIFLRGNSRRGCGARARKPGAAIQEFVETLGRFGGILGVREFAAAFAGRRLLRPGDSAGGYRRLAKRRQAAALHRARSLT